MWCYSGFYWCHHHLISLSSVTCSWQLVHTGIDAINSICLWWQYRISPPQNHRRNITIVTRSIMYALSFLWPNRTQTPHFSKMSSTSIHQTSMGWQHIDSMEIYMNLTMNHIYWHFEAVVRYFQRIISSSSCPRLHIKCEYDIKHGIDVIKNWSH